MIEQEWRWVKNVSSNCLYFESLVKSTLKHLEVCLEGPRNITKNVNQYGGAPIWESNRLHCMTKFGQVIDYNFDDINPNQRTDTQLANRGAEPDWHFITFRCLHAVLSSWPPCVPNPHHHHHPTDVFLCFWPIWHLASFPIVKFYSYHNRCCGTMPTNYCRMLYKLHVFVEAGRQRRYLASDLHDVYSGPPSNIHHFSKLLCTVYTQHAPN